MAIASAGEDDPVPALLNGDEYDAFAEGDLDYFLTAAGDRLRRFCGWHVWPSLTMTGVYDVSGDGTIMLPTRRLTGVTSVSPPWDAANPVDAGTYRWDERGWITLSARGYGFAPTAASAELWPIDTIRMFDPYPKHQRRLQVTFTHGYEAIPPVVAEVGHEITMRALEKQAGVASEVKIANTYSFKFLEFGLVLSDDQKTRLAPFIIPGIA